VPERACKAGALPAELHAPLDRVIGSPPNTWASEVKVAHIIYGIHIYGCHYVTNNEKCPF
jgi:hypothetical protein